MGSVNNVHLQKFPSNNRTQTVLYIWTGCVGVCVEVLQFNYKAVNKLQVSEENTQPWKSSMVEKSGRKEVERRDQKSWKYTPRHSKEEKRVIWTEEKIKVSELYACCVLWTNRSKPEWNLRAISRNR